MKNKGLEYINRRLPAEWERCGRILMSWPHIDTDWADVIEEAREQFARLTAAFVSTGDKVLMLTANRQETMTFLMKWFDRNGFDVKLLDSVDYLCYVCNDTWTRDYGPLSVINEDNGDVLTLDFGFNAWGLKFAAGKDNQATAFMARHDVIPHEGYVDCRDFILEGGSVETDGKGTLLTTSECLMNPNRNPAYTRSEIEDILRKRLGFTRFLWLEHGHIEGDDTDSHIDTLARLAPGDVIYYCGPGEKMNESLVKMRDELKALRTADGQPYHLVELPLPDAIYDDEGNRLAATYANYLVTEKAVYVPIYQQPLKDEMAVMMLSLAYHDHKIVPVDCTTLIKQGGSLHCSTMQLL